MIDRKNVMVGTDGAAALMDFEVADVTRTQRVMAKDVQRTLPAGTVAQSLASRMALPQNVSWTLREDSTSRFLDEEKAIGDQLGPGAKVTLTPKTHLG